MIATILVDRPRPNPIVLPSRGVTSSQLVWSLNWDQTFLNPDSSRRGSLYIVVITLHLAACVRVYVVLGAPFPFSFVDIFPRSSIGIIGRIKFCSA